MVIAKFKEAVAVYHSFKKNISTAPKNWAYNFSFIKRNFSVTCTNTLMMSLAPKCFRHSLAISVLIKRSVRSSRSTKKASCCFVLGWVTTPSN